MRSQFMALALVRTYAERKNESLNSKRAWQRSNDTDKFQPTKTKQTQKPKR